MLKRLMMQVVGEVSSLGSLPAYFGIMILAFLFRGAGDAVTLLVWLAMSFLVAAVIRMIFYKSRPENKGKKRPSGFFERIDASSFPSVHTSRAGVLAVYLYQLQPGLLSLSLAVAFVFCIGISRMFLLKHDMVDVLFGGLMGIGIALII